MQSAEAATPAILGVFFALATAITAAAALTLFYPGAPLEIIWAIKPDQHRQLLAYNVPAGTGFVVLGLICGAACLGSFRRRKWGWALAAAIIVVNFLADIAHVALAFTVANLAGPVVAGLVLWWLARPGVRSRFRSGRDPA